jgi:hypothetical protein
MENTSSGSNRHLPSMLQEPVDSTLSNPRIIKEYFRAGFYTSRTDKIFHRDVANLQILEWGGSMVRYHLIYHFRNLTSAPFNPSPCFLSRVTSQDGEYYGMQELGHVTNWPHLCPVSK